MSDRDLQTTFTPLLDALFEQSAVHAACLWERVDDEFRSVLCRGVIAGAPTRFRPDADVESWLASGGAMSWRITDRRAWEGATDPPDGRVHLAMAVSGLLLEVTAAADFSDGDLEAVLDLVAAFGDVVAERRGPSAMPVASEDLPALRLVDLTFVESVAMGDRDFVMEILSLSEASFEAGWRTIRSQLDAGALGGAAAEAHKLRSTARTVGASLLDDQLLELELSADLEAARSEAESVGAAVDTVVREIRWLLERMH